MGVQYKGLDCLLDINNATYLEYGDQSLLKISEDSLARFGRITIYFGVATVFVSTSKYLFYRLADKRYTLGSTEYGFLTSLVFVFTAYFRFIAYQPVPRVLTTWLSFPFSWGNCLYAMVTSIYLLCVCLIPHFWYRGCFGFGFPPLGDRAGVMATSLMPFLYLLSGKFNLISFLTGIGYEKLNWLHQYLGVAVLTLALIHCIPFIYQPLREGGILYLRDSFQSIEDYQHGTAAFVLLFLLCCMFKREIRQRVYEISFHFHWILGVGFFAALTFHVYGMLAMQNYMWATLGIWFVQWIVRVFRYGLVRSRTAHLEVKGHSSFEIIVQNPSGIEWVAGQHCLLRFPGVGPLENHPFSIASTEKDEHLKFLIISRSGFTRRLFNLIGETQQKKRVIVDGPYGGISRNPSSFDQIILVASGNGVTATIPYLISLANSATPQLVRFIWIVREIGDVQWFEEELNRCYEVASERIIIDIYVTSETEQKISDEKLTIKYGKPNIPSIVSPMRNALLRRNLMVCSGSDSLKREICSLAAEFQTAVFSNLHVEEVCLYTETYSI